MLDGGFVIPKTNSFGQMFRFQSSYLGQILSSKDIKGQSHSPILTFSIILSMLIWVLLLLMTTCILCDVFEQNGRKIFRIKVEKIKILTNQILDLISRTSFPFHFLFSFKGQGFFVLFSFWYGKKRFISQLVFGNMNSSYLSVCQRNSSLSSTN